MRQSAATNSPVLVSASGLISSERDSADPCASCGPSLNLHHNFAAQFLRSRGSFVGARDRAAARDLESVRSKNRFALILVKSRHGCVLFPMKTPNVQPACAQG